MTAPRSLALLAALVSLALAGCGSGAPSAPTDPPTLSSDDVMSTAEAIAEATRQASTPTPTRQLATPTPTDVPTTATPSATSTASSPVVIADYNANVRSGPGEEFDPIDFLYEGDPADVQGRFMEDEIGVWYFITRQDQGIPGWIWSGAVTLQGDPNVIPILESPPTPTPGPSPTPEGG